MRRFHAITNRLHRYAAFGLAVFALVLFGLAPSVAAQTVDQQITKNDINDVRSWPFYDSATTASSCSSGTTTLTGSDNEQIAFNFFVQKGLTGPQAAGIVGNMIIESGVNPNNSQDGLHDPTPIANIGFGIGQWTTAGRQQGLVQLAEKENVAPTELGVQLDYSWQELTTTYIQALTDLKATTTASDTAGVIMNEYEMPLERVLNLQLRSAAANSVLAQYGASASNVGTTNTDCNPVNCNSSASNSLSSIRQNVVCEAQQELALWMSQPNYNAPYPAFTYAATGFLKYSDNNYEEWCADFVSWIYNQAGYPFSGGSSGGWRLAGVSGIQQLGAADGNFHWHPASSNYTPKPGDLALYYNAADTNPWFHVNIFISSSGGVSTYIGGDQGGVDQPDDAFGTKSPPSGSIVSIQQGTGYYSNGIAGYVSPD